MQKYFTTRQIVELTFICGMWNLSGRVAEALHLVVEPPGRRITFQG
jgi:alkylhydroperoxidase family enzyme